MARKYKNRLVGEVVETYREQLNEFLTYLTSSKRRISQEDSNYFSLLKDLKTYAKIELKTLGISPRELTENNSINLLERKISKLLAV